MLISRFQHRLTAFFSSRVNGFAGGVDATDPAFGVVFFARTTGLATERDSVVSFGVLGCTFCSGCAAIAGSQHTTQVPMINHPDALFIISILIG
jgi:hypothetical protein